MEGKQKVHLSQEDPPTVTTIQGAVLVETLCARYSQQAFVALIQEYKQWLEWGRSETVFCKYCRQEA